MILNLSILGMNLFVGKFYTVDSSGEIEYERKNFDSLFWAAITVFQVNRTDYTINNSFNY